MKKKMLQNIKKVLFHDSENSSCRHNADFYQCSNASELLNKILVKQTKTLGTETTTFAGCAGTRSSQEAKAGGSGVLGQSGLHILTRERGREERREDINNILHLVLQSKETG